MANIEIRGRSLRIKCPKCHSLDIDAINAPEHTEWRCSKCHAEFHLRETLPPGIRSWV